MGIKDFIARKKKEKEEREKLKAEILEELRPEIKEMEKKKIREELLAKAEKKSNGKNLLKALGEEFKSSNMGSNEQMERMLGKSSGGGGLHGQLRGAPLKDSSKLAEMMGGHKLDTNRDFGGMLGRDNKTTQKDAVNFFGVQKKQNKNVK